VVRDAQTDSGDSKYPPLTKLIRLPPGRHGLPRELVRRNQRERLIAGATKAVEERGFAKATVSDIVRHAGISRKTFYEHFANKEECLEIAYKKPANRGDGQGAAPTKPRATGVSVNLPASTRAREKLIDHHQRERLIAGATKAVEERGFAKATVSDIIRCARASRSTFYKHFASKEECIEATYGASLESLQEKEGEQRFGSPVTRGKARASSPSDSPEPLPPDSTQLPRGLPRELVRRNQYERLITGVAKAVAERGFARVTVSDIIRHAGVSRPTFYEHFANKEECLQAARGISLAPGSEETNPAADLS
jgi:AcrR family transcriptional regulator